jgi:hypothetical protein
MTTAPPDSKHAALVTVLEKALVPLTKVVQDNATSEQKAIAALTATVNTALSKIAELQAAVAAVKDIVELKAAGAPLPAAERKTGGRAPRASPAKKGDAKYNIMTFFRHAAATNYEGTRDKWITPEVEARYANEASVKKLEGTRGSDPSPYYSAIANCYWKALVAADRENFRQTFDYYKQQAAGAAAPAVEAAAEELPLDDAAY